jgi:proteic killer suppression protein
MLHLDMIKSIQHKGLRLFYEDDNSSKLPAAHVTRIRNILTRLEFARSLDDIGTPGSRLHPLSGQLKGFHAVNVSGNWRIIFRFEDGHVHDVDYLDYH